MEELGLRSYCEHEPGALHRHDRPIFQPRDVRHAEDVPEDNVGAVKRAILLHPCRQPLPNPGALAGELPAGVPLLAAVGSDPQVVLQKRTSPQKVGLRVRQWQAVGGRYQPVPCWLACSVHLPGVAHLCIRCRC